ncbi:hypothetical protein DC3_40410 [Deinococcus cellulosilyticus NBRC 106333 = KACC 11606]|uniref:histidine kinase n=1 Tax=Deinococcus cellulosilyticus (strain DSM 18568 / NBRC 106333 / KACC 11606 / 5516J-15) TaxID=1223518 RepID=A0A511N7G3_DEIC1|nr:hypothetical protein DC3_40410 [Deinococcus cellulosilyticus NBRC 106333 = KACC 11606]
MTLTLWGVVLFTAFMVFLVLAIITEAYFKSMYQHSTEILSQRFGIPAEQLEKVVQEAGTRAEAVLEWRLTRGDEGEFFLILLAVTVLLPFLLAWWSSRRFARPLTQLSRAAHLLTRGDFSARVPMDKSLERRGDETALLLKDFNQMAASLERLEQERRYSLAAIAHELRTPVTVLRGRLEGVRDGVLAAGPVEFEKLLGHADLLGKLIEDLQVLSLAEAGALRLEQQHLVMQDLLKRVAGDFTAKAEEKHIGLQLDLPLEPVRVNGDPERLYQVLGNVLGNALRHTPPHGHIHIQLVEDRQKLILEMADSGPGFTPEALERAFERFYRSPDRGRQSGGSGLGMALSKSLIEAHGGQIELFNSSSGACVRITLQTQ